MSKRKCIVCEKEGDIGWPGAKICGNCGIFLCGKDGMGKTQCPHCHKYTLK